MKKLILIMFSIFLNIQCYTEVFSQITDDISKFENIKLYKPDKKADYTFAKEQFKTYQVVFSGLFLFYKHFLSSQDKGSCPFHISCSEYFIKSIQSKGVILGFLNGVDRYKRCNGYSNHKYKRDPETGKLYDPVDIE